MHYLQEKNVSIKETKNIRLVLIFNFISPEKKRDSRNELVSNCLINLD